MSQAKIIKKVCSSWLFCVACDGGVSLVLDWAFCLNPEKEDSILSSSDPGPVTYGVMNYTSH